MVPRYARPEMTALWEAEAKYRIWFEIEAHATEKLGELGVVPPSAANFIIFRRFICIFILLLIQRF